MHHYKNITNNRTNLQDSTCGYFAMPVNTGKIANSRDISPSLTD